VDYLDGHLDTEFYKELSTGDNDNNNKDNKNATFKRKNNTNINDNGNTLDNADEIKNSIVISSNNMKAKIATEE